MAKFVLAYTGGSMAQTPEEQQQVMAAWGAWFGELGAALSDPGTPFGRSQTVGSAGAVSDGGRSALTGYSILTADSLEAATQLSMACPVLANGGAIEVYETVDMATPE